MATPKSNIPKMLLEDMAPRYDYDCDQCLFIGRTGEYDIYLHNGSEQYEDLEVPPTFNIIAVYGEAEKYQSGADTAIRSMLEDDGFILGKALKTVMGSDLVHVRNARFVINQKLFEVAKRVQALWLGDSTHIEKRALKATDYPLNMQELL